MVVVVGVVVVVVVVDVVGEAVVEGWEVPAPVVIVVLTWSPPLEQAPTSRRNPRSLNRIPVENTDDQGL